MVLLNKFLKKPFGLFIITAFVTLCVARFVSLFFFAIAQQYPQANEQFINDGFHHYYLGVLVLIVWLIVKKWRWAVILAGVGTGIFLEEWPIIVDNMGFKGVSNFYLSGWDLAVSVLLLILFVMALKYKSLK